jgi:hypothetical protein
MERKANTGQSRYYRTTSVTIDHSPKNSSDEAEYCQGDAAVSMAKAPGFTCHILSLYLKSKVYARGFPADGRSQAIL